MSLTGFSLPRRVAKFPNPDAPGVPGSGRNWVLGAIAYVTCWFIWIFGVFLGYELVYSFYRRWRFRELSDISTFRQISSPSFARPIQVVPSSFPSISPPRLSILSPCRRTTTFASSSTFAPRHSLASTRAPSSHPLRARCAMRSRRHATFTRRTSPRS